MANDVAITSALRSNLLSLQNTQSMMDKSQLVLSTGRKVNSALDGAQAFFTAKSLNDRAGDLSRLLDGLGQSISTIQSADQAVSALVKLVDQADALANQARDRISTAAAQATASGTEDIGRLDSLGGLGGISGTENGIRISTSDDTADVAIQIAKSADTLIADINDSALQGAVKASLTAGGQLQVASLTEGSYLRIEGEGTTGLANGVGEGGFASLGLGEFVGAEGDGAGGTRVGGTIVAGNSLSSRAATAGTVASDTLDAAGFTKDFSTGTGSDTVDFTLTVDGVVGTSYTIDEDTTIQQLVDHVNNDTALEGKVTASFDQDTGKISLKTNGDVSNVVISNEVTGTDTGSNSLNVNFGFGDGRSDGGTDVLLFPGGASLDDVNDLASESITFSGGTADVTQLQNDYNELRNQIDGLVADASYRGVNLLKSGTLTTTFNEDRSNKLITEGVDFTASGLGISKGSFTNEASVDSSISQLRNAKTAARSFGESIANDLAIIQTREGFTKSTINTLETGADKLTLADQNEEGARMLALQPRQQIGFVSLSLASQASQGILRLF